MSYFTSFLYKYRYIIAFAFAFLLYSQTTTNGWILDDYGVITNNKFVTSGTDGFADIATKPYREGFGMYDDLYRPVSQLLFATLWQISPDNTFLFHLVIILLYATLCVLILRLLEKWLQNLPKLLPFLITIMFAAHPIHTEVVANVKSADELLSFLFVIITCLLTLKLSKRKGIKLFLHFVLIGITFLLAMFAKESAITFCAVIPLSLYFFCNETSKRNYIVVTSVLVFVAGFYIFVRHQVLTNSVMYFDFPLDPLDNFLVNADFVSRYATAIMLCGKYILMLFVPYPLACDYSYSQFPLVSFSNIYVLISIAIIIGLLGLATLLVKRKSPISFGILYFFITFSIFSNLVILIGSTFSERFLFTPSLGFCIILGIFGLKIYQKIKLKNLILIAFVLIMICYSTITIARTFDWKTDNSLYTKDIKTNPNSGRLYFLLGKDIELEGNKLKTKNPEKYVAAKLEAIEIYKKGCLIYPIYYECRDQLARAYEDVYKIKNEPHYLDSVEKYFRINAEVLEDAVYPNCNLAIFLFGQARYAEAIKHYKIAFKLDTNYYVPMFPLGNSYTKLGEYDSAKYYYQKAINKKVNVPESYFGLGYCYMETGDFEKAVDNFAKSLNIDASELETWHFYIYSLGMIKRWEDAEIVVVEGVSRFPNDEYILNSVAFVEEKLGRKLKKKNN